MRRNSMSNAVTAGSVAILSALSFTSAPQPTQDFLSQSKQSTIASKYHSSNSISWSSYSLSISDQIGSTFSDTYTGKRGFIIAKVQPALEYGQADQLDDDDFLYE